MADRKKKIITTVYSARHGETAFNAQFLLCGWIDLPLTGKGLVQADQLTALVKDKQIDAIYCSDLLRARQTAERVGLALGLVPMPDARLREVNFGGMERCSRGDPAFKRMEQVFAERFPEGESVLQAAHRVYGFLDEMLAECAGKNVLLVSHGWTNKLIASYFRNLSNEEFGSYVLPNCGYAVYEYETDK
ncbi:MAG: histidine phosphatase family protein [Clostridia bacterium]|nr:histidine phosphatase family protein [Clostridia bacterium]